MITPLALIFLAGMLVNTAVGDCQRPKAEIEYYADAYADHYRVPRALVHAIIRQESNWNPQALSNKGAVGLMQLMPATAETYRVRDRYSVTESISGGVQYLADLLNQFGGEMRLAVAAYYCGAGQIDRYGLSYRNPEVWAYVESVRRRYQRELREQPINRSSVSAGGQ
jgi:soluble lytic murein transglycosylase-like protein